MKIASGITILTITALLGTGGCGTPEPKPETKANTLTRSTLDEVFQGLTDVRQTRRSHIVEYFNTAQSLAQDIPEDQFMTGAFVRLRKHGAPRSAHEDSEIDTHFVKHYGIFYDILFVDQSGLVFHSILRETDYKKNIIDGALSNSKLAKRLPTSNTITFVDYEAYGPSREAGAFFIVPLFRSNETISGNSKGIRLGWFVLQCSLNRLNAILSDRRHLGRTGETYLVNTTQQMVTDSRFRPKTDGLKLKVDTLAVKTALQKGAGQKVIRDYRGVHVLSSFEPFDVFGTTWVVVAEIDENEVITNHYKMNKTAYQEKMGEKVAVKAKRQTWVGIQEAARRVDINEFQRADATEVLFTKGVSTCTAIAVTQKGRFGYLAHIGPTDRIYDQPDKGHNDRLADMLYQVKQFDIRPFETRELEVTVVATHKDSLSGTVNRLIDMGIELAQIKFAFNPDARLANLLVNPQTGGVSIDWTYSDGSITTSSSADIKSLGSIIKGLMPSRHTK